MNVNRRCNLNVEAVGGGLGSGFGETGEDVGDGWGRKVDAGYWWCCVVEVSAEAVFVVSCKCGRGRKGRAEVKNVESEERCDL